MQKFQGKVILPHATLAVASNFSHSAVLVAGMPLEPSLAIRGHGDTHLFSGCVLGPFLMAFRAWGITRWQGIGKDDGVSSMYTERL